MTTNKGSTDDKSKDQGVQQCSGDANKLQAKPSNKIGSYEISDTESQLTEDCDADCCSST